MRARTRWRRASAGSGLISTTSTAATNSRSEPALPPSEGRQLPAYSPWSGRFLAQLRALILRETKTFASDAVLPLPKLCIDALRAHQIETERRRALAGPAWHDTGLVITTRYGLPADPRNFHRKFKERAAKAGVPTVTVHSTRSTCASSLVELDVHPRVANANPPPQQDRGHDGDLRSSAVG